MIKRVFGLLLSQILAFGLMVLVVLSCQKKDDVVAQPKTIADLLLEDKQFSLLRAAVAYADAGDALKGANLTLLAPSDAAFQASGFPTEAAIRALSKDQVKQVLLYHVLNGPVSSTAIPVGVNSVQTASKGVAYLNKTSGGTIYVNSAKITRADIVVANGFVHVIDRVLAPSVGNMLTTIKTAPNLTLLAAAVKRISLVSPSLLATIDNPTSASAVTLFAPTDDAFRAAGYASTAAIETSNAQTLASILSYHLLPGVSLSYQFQPGAVNTLLNGNRLTILVTGSTVTVKGNRNPAAATVRTPDLVTTNGVIHIIDQVLLP